MRFVTRLVAVAVAAATSVAVAQDKVELNTITKVQVSGATISVVGNKKPNFTTFTMTDPPRLVIDISEAVFSGVPEEQQIGNGVVTAIKTASYGSDASAIARVLIGFEKEYETDIQSSDTKLVVKVLGAGSAGEAVAQAPAQPAAQPPEAAKADPAVQAAAQAAAQAAVDRAAADKAAADKAAREQAEAKKQEALAAKQAAEEEKKQKAEAAAAEREAKRQEALAAKQAAAEEKKRLAEEAAAEREAKRQEALAAREQKVAMAEPRSAGGGEAESSSSLSVSSRRKTMTFVGFKQEPGGQRVYVRTNEPVRYSLQREGDKQVVLELENTSIALGNNARFMDTSYFNGAVAMVQPQHGPTRTVRIEITLKENVPYEAKQEGNEVYVDFQTGGR